MPLGIALAGAEVDLTSRIVHSETVVGSPAAASETIIAQVTIPTNVPIVAGCLLMGWAAYTVGTNGTAVQLQIRQTNVSGAVKANSGALTGSQHGAAILSADDVNGFDSAPAASQVYCLTMTVTNGSATSTVSAVELVVIVL